MPTTASRRRFMPSAVLYFLRQDYPGAELLLLDDSPAPMPELWPETAPIQYRYGLGPFSSLGAKRNYACAQATGDIIIHLDDDDWYAPGWISRQVQVLQEQEADICGLNELCFYKPEQQLAWRYKYGYNHKPWVAGATMAYRKKVWERHPFPDKHIGEDNHFIWSAGSKIVAHDYTNGFVSLLHDHNTSPKYTFDPQWGPIPLSQIQDMLGADFLRYA
ncbi:glycosyltransferase family A protein [Taibaiella chishuiensis]|nr:glycosyltransferase family A protein [Taibaiella chishuiensis]